MKRSNKWRISQSEVHLMTFDLVNGIQDTLDSVQRMLQDQQQKVQSLSLNLSTSQVNILTDRSHFYLVLIAQ